MANKIGKMEIVQGFGIGAITIVIGLLAEAIARDTGVVEKLSKRKSNYQNPYSASPFGDMIGPIRYKCSDCLYFKDGNACRIVSGPILPLAGCNRWLGVKAEKN